MMMMMIIIIMIMIMMMIMIMIMIISIINNVDRFVLLTYARQHSLGGAHKCRPTRSTRMSSFIALAVAPPNA